MAQSRNGEGEGTETTPSINSKQPESKTSGIEMSAIDTSKRSEAGEGAQRGLLHDVTIPQTSPMDATFAAQDTTQSSKGKERAVVPDDSTTNPTMTTPEAPQNLLSPQAEESASSATKPAAPAMTRQETEAIGPSIEDIGTGKPADATGPVLVITLLLTSGSRHPYKIDDKYLTKRNVTVPETTETGLKDPFSISVYTLKELILREWRQEWEAAPSSPSSIRLIFFGRLLDDKSALKECRFNTETPNVVHMTVRPQDVVDDEEATKGKSGGREGRDSESTAGCRCVIL